MIIESKGIEIDEFYIPPFELNNGDLIVICLWGGGHYHNLKIIIRIGFNERPRLGRIPVCTPLINDLSAR